MFVIHFWEICETFFKQGVWGRAKKQHERETGVFCNCPLLLPLCSVGSEIAWKRGARIPLQGRLRRPFEKRETKRNFRVRLSLTLVVPKLLRY